MITYEFGDEIFNSNCYIYEYYIAEKFPSRRVALSVLLLLAVFVVLKKLRVGLLDLNYYHYLQIISIIVVLTSLFVYSTLSSPRAIKKAEFPMPKATHFHKFNENDCFKTCS